MVSDWWNHRVHHLTSSLQPLSVYGGQTIALSILIDTDKQFSPMSPFSPFSPGLPEGPEIVFLFEKKRIGTFDKVSKIGDVIISIKMKVSRVLCCNMN